MPEKKHFPLLHENVYLIAAIKAVQLAERSVENITANIQNGCEHDFDETLVDDPNYIWSAFNRADKKVLNSKTCEKCGFEVKRPNGSAWQICHKCWSPMEHEGTIPGQGERTFVYKCKNPKCGHVVSHT